MPAKKKAKPVKKGKPAPKKKALKREKKGNAYQCSVCGYRLVVDEACGCAEEHVFVCCNKVMKKKSTGRK